MMGMDVQVSALTARGLKACFLGSAQTNHAVTQGAWAGEYQFIYITPELAASRLSALQQLQRDHVSTQTCAHCGSCITAAAADCSWQGCALGDRCPWCDALMPHRPSSAAGSVSGGY